MIGKKSTPKITGALIGFVNGLFGAGGGMIAIEMLKKTGNETKKAHAIAVATILPISIVSVIFYLKKIKIDPNIFFVAVSAIPGGFVGSKLLYKIKSKWISKIFYSLMIVAGIKMLLN